MVFLTILSMYGEKRRKRGDFKGGKGVFFPCFLAFPPLKTKPKRKKGS